ncbi:MAG: SsrA-binding protein [Parcubacteria group bacterium Gr01-1014_19]|nr:MAG: SsrA-binding protein [Parcubacteria group bacterium Gr01-1014_19]
MNSLAENKKAFFNYEISETFEAGIELKGFEVKSVKAGQANLLGAFATIKGGEIWLTNADIPPFQSANTPPDYNPTRPRRLLLNKKEILYLVTKMKSDRLTLLPLKMYSKKNLVKIELGLARGKRQYEKRESIEKREVGREIRRAKN